ncbi:MAG: hypothetical protein ACYCOU_03030 [Sulfobacillus sp.]
MTKFLVVVAGVDGSGKTSLCNYAREFETEFLFTERSDGLRLREPTDVDEAVQEFDLGKWACIPTGCIVLTADLDEILERVSAREIADVWETPKALAYYHDKFLELAEEHGLPVFDTTYEPPEKTYQRVLAHLRSSEKRVLPEKSAQPIFEVLPEKSAQPIFEVLPEKSAQPIFEVLPEKSAQPIFEVLPEKSAPEKTLAEKIGREILRRNGIPYSRKCKGGDQKTTCVKVGARVRRAAEFYLRQVGAADFLPLPESERCCGDDRNHDLSDFRVCADPDGKVVPTFMESVSPEIMQRLSDYFRHNSFYDTEQLYFYSYPHEPGFPYGPFSRPAKPKKTFVGGEANEPIFEVTEFQELRREDFPSGFPKRIRCSWDGKDREEFLWWLVEVPRTVEEIYVDAPSDEDFFLSAIPRVTATPSHVV